MDIETFKAKYSYNTTTPMMQQYLDVKFMHLECLVLFRMGDFYELFYDDAIIAAKVLGIALAKRTKQDESFIPMCGVPYHSLESYLNKLLKNGYKIAICDQVETPEEAKLRGYKAIVKREVVRIITPGTITEDSILDQHAPNYLVAIVPSKRVTGKEKVYETLSDNKALKKEQDTQEFAICSLDISTSEFTITTTSNLASELAKLSPKEILCSQNLQLNESILEILFPYKQSISYYTDSYFDFKKATHTIMDFYNLANIKPLGELKEHEIAAIGAVLSYVKLTQKSNLPGLNYPKSLNELSYLYIDAATRKNLEIVKSVCGEYKGSLLSAINKTSTKAGSRLLYKYINSPLNNAGKILERHNLTEIFYSNINMTIRLREMLKNCLDIERIITKISMGKGNWQQLISLKNTLQIASQIKPLLEDQQEEIIHKLLKFFNIDYRLKADIENSVIEEDLQITINHNFYPQVKELYKRIEDANQMIENLKLKYQKETGIENLKITSNNLIGYYVEVTSKAASKVNTVVFQHKQSLLNNVRYTTDELKNVESKILSARAELEALELEVYNKICSKVMQQAAELKLLAQGVALVDVFTNFAFIAKEYNYTKPEVTESTEFKVLNGRHVTVEQSLKNKSIDFIENSCNLDGIWVITGPNMAGKSTFMRQNALIIILAQMGCFVPAEYAKIGIVDKLFSRIGASDDIAAGNSTFMVEMLETAAILSQATSKSFIILDEIGRGTSTYDGVSIALSCLEYIHDEIKCRTLFATHYHEIPKLSHALKNVKNYNMKIAEHNDKLILLHKIVEGIADKSYGINVASLAGLPPKVISRAKEILGKLEKGEVERIEIGA